MEECSEDKKNEVKIKATNVIETYKKIDHSIIMQNMIEAIHYGLENAIDFFEKNDLETILGSMRIGNSSNSPL